MADITAEWVIGIEDATGGHPYGPGGSNHTGQALLNINSTWNEYLGAYHSERRSIREQYGNWGDTPMKDVMEMFLMMDSYGNESIVFDVHVNVHGHRYLHGYRTSF